MSLSCMIGITGSVASGAYQTVGYDTASKIDPAGIWNNATGRLEPGPSIGRDAVYCFMIQLSWSGDEADWEEGTESKIKITNGSDEYEDIQVVATLTYAFPYVHVAKFLIEIPSDGYVEALFYQSTVGARSLYSSSSRLICYEVT